jgi:exonuclease-1
MYILPGWHLAERYSALCVCCCRYVTYCMSRVEMLRRHGVDPVIIFDGGRLPLKAEEEDTRRRCACHHTAPYASGSMRMMQCLLLSCCLNAPRCRARQENKAKAAQHLQAGNMSAAYECYQRAVDVTPAMAKHLIEVCDRAWLA